MRLLDSVNAGGGHGQAIIKQPGGAHLDHLAAVIAGVAIMVSESLDGAMSPVGDGLALPSVAGQSR